jgi:hypothetical protein
VFVYHINIGHIVLRGGVLFPPVPGCSQCGTSIGRGYIRGDFGPSVVPVNGESLSAHETTIDSLSSLFGLARDLFPR